MNNNADSIFLSLVNAVSSMDEVKSIGKTGEPALPQAGESDIDICIYCDSIPQQTVREAALRPLALQNVNVNASQTKHWGVIDYIEIQGIETFLMYFTINETVEEVEAILSGNRLNKEDNYFYPTGRLAMFKNINILLDKDGFLASMKSRLAQYPAAMADKLIAYHLEQLRDIEDLERAVLRSDPLFFHFALDLALDHFLQALFAKNGQYFPSRKRTTDLLEAFLHKPIDCANRLLKVVELGGLQSGISQAYSLWRDLVEDLAGLCS